MNKMNKINKMKEITRDTILNLERGGLKSLMVGWHFFNTEGALNPLEQAGVSEAWDYVKGTADYNTYKMLEAENAIKEALGVINGYALKMKKHSEDVTAHKAYLQDCKTDAKAAILSLFDNELDPIINTLSDTVKNAIPEMEGMDKFDVRLFVDGILAEEFKNRYRQVLKSSFNVNL